MFISPNLKHGDQQVNRNKRDGITHSELIQLFFNKAIGTGPVRLGYRFRCGSLLAPAIGLATGLISLYQLLLYGQIAASSDSELYENNWNSKIMKYVSKAASLAILVSTFVLYMSFMMETISSLSKSLFSNITTNINNHVTYIVVLLLVFFVPISISNRKNTVIKLSIAANVFSLILLVNAIYWFVVEVRSNGFNALGQMKLWSFDKSVIVCASGFITAYQVIPVAYPGVRDVSNATIHSLNRSFILFTVICWLYYVLIGEFSYLTLFDKNQGAVVLNYYPEHPVKHLAQLSLVFKMCFTISPALNTMRFVLVNGSEVRKLPNLMWFCYGVILSIILSFMILLPSIAQTIFGYLCDVSSIVLSYILIPCQFLSNVYSTKANKVGCGLLIGVGIVLLGQFFFV